MANGVNKVILVGRLGQDPDVRYMPNGNAVANVSMATSDTWKDKESGQKMEKAEWHRVVFFGKIAEIVGQYVTKGSNIYVEGALRTRKWQDQSGQDRYTTEIVVDMNGQMQMLGGRNDANSGGYAPQPQQHAPQQAPLQPSNQNPNGSQRSAYADQAPQQTAQEWMNDFDDDIKF